MTYLIVGLGNIGSKYECTRHNIGFDVVDEIARHFGVAFKTSKLANIAEIRTNNTKIILIKPTTYMNLSGEALFFYKNYYKIPVENILTIVDDLSLPFGKLKLKAKGSPAGHNGLKSIQSHLGTQVYPRLKFGIGNQFPRGQQVAFVLGKWSKQEQEELASYKNEALKVVLSFIENGIETTMNEFN